MIVILRNPVDRAFSAWKMRKEYHSLKKLPNNKLINDKDEFLSFRECVQMELELIEKNNPEEPTFIRKGFYATQIACYLKYFNENQSASLRW